MDHQSRIWMRPWTVIQGTRKNQIWLRSAAGRDQPREAQSRNEENTEASNVINLSIHSRHLDADEREAPDRPVSPVPSCLSMKTDRSMDYPLNFKLGDLPQEKGEAPDRPVSPVPSCLSMKTDRSMDYPLNFKLGDLPQEKGMQPEEVFCDVCDDKAVTFCQTCTLSYCQTHVMKHYTVPKLQTHKLVKLTEGLEDGFCQEHQRPVEVFCRTDQMFICSLCSVTKHKGHDTIHVEVKIPGIQSKNFDGHRTPTSDNELSSPEKFQVMLLTSDSVSLSWSSPQGVEGPQTFRVTWECNWEKMSSRVKGGHHLEISSLKPGEKYRFTVATEGDDGRLSRSISTSLYTVVPPRDLIVDNLEDTSFTLHWTKGEGMDEVPQHFLITYSSPETDLEPRAINTQNCYRTFSNLQPGSEYRVSVVTVLNSGEESEPVYVTIQTLPLAPDQLIVYSVDTTSATVIWDQPPGLDQTHHHYQISYQCPGTEPYITTTSSPSITLSDLKPDTEYSVSVSTVLDNGLKSQMVLTTLITKIPAPVNFTVEERKFTSLRIRWTKGVGLEQTPQHFLISYFSPGKEPITLNTEYCYRTLSDLQPGTQYTVSVSTVLNNGLQSEPVSINVCTVPLPPEQLTVDSVDTTSATVIWNQPPGLDQTHHHYQISYQCPGTEPHITTSSPSINLSDLKPATEYTVTVCTVMDDGIQSQLVSTAFTTKVPAPCDLTIEDLKSTSLTIRWTKDLGLDGTRQHFLISYCSPGNKTKTVKTEDCYRTLSDLQPGTQYTVSVSTVLNGLQSEPASTNACTVLPTPDQLTVDQVDTTSATVIWNQPPGLDQTHHHYQIFYQCPGTEPHITTTSSPSITLSDLKPATEYSVTLCTVMDNGKSSHLVLTTINTMVPSPDQLTVDSVETTSATVIWNKPPGLDQTHHQYQISYQCPGTEQHITTTSSPSVTLSDLNPATGYSVNVCTVMDDGRKSQPVSTTLNTMLPAPDQLIVDSVDPTSATVIWNQPPGLDQTHHHYQISYQCPGTEPHITTTSLPRITLSDLKPATEYSVTVCTVMENGMKSQLVSTAFTTRYLLQKLLSDVGLADHYENKLKLSTFLEINADTTLDEPLKTLQSIPGHFLKKLMMANVKLEEMLLDGFPVELVDGDASNIPLKWISDVLTQLHTIVSSNSKIRVVTVLGVQSTGKSTLLNTMFGVQFAVSSGRCTRGAFMQLIKVNKELKEELKCDFIMVIDTEGLKSLELSKLEDSYEHDNELATLVVGLSDFTIINISMENSTEMKDILQIVVHAFLRMKEVGKKPVCHFVHQNVSDMSAHDNNMRAREELLEQLNEMTQAAARMENKDNITKFTDVMKYDPNTSSSYIPGLWYGTPPMAPVNAGYSEAVYDFKKSLIQDALDSIMMLNYSEKTDQFADNLTEFVEEMEQTLEVKYIHEKDITERLRSLPFKPQDKMFTSLFGCGEVCPFCKSPCEAGGKEHSKHFTSVHRPQGVSGISHKESNRLVSNICSSSVISDRLFKTSLTKGQYHPYKDYQKYYPEWNIAGDSSIEASDYWKYVMATFNEIIAKDGDALPAVIPEDWKALTTEDAIKSLKCSFNIKD
ncbi:hypothetical protein UPYG_G00047130 [Umbra pygmaea]|uniref:Interferon-induced very large GTPase 1-like n=1 Tax=Umbra pygmaea TaxID=75934 RepID=A0ABD0XRB9_UMBPY